MERIFLSSPHMSDEGYEKRYVQEAFSSNWIAPLGENVTTFEDEIKEFIKTDASVALVSGTAALHLAYKSVGIKEGDILFCQDLTFSATVNPILYEKAIPVFIDSEKDSWNMSSKALRKAFIKYQQLGQLPKAVVVVHLYGNAADIQEIQSICEYYNVPLIEDAAESLGTSIKGQYTGTFGEYGVLSFNGNKIITSSGGGMLLCNGKEANKDARKALFWATQARENVQHYEHQEIGYNYRMSNVIAGIGRGQLQVLNQRIEKKRYIYDYYKKFLSVIKDITFMPIDTYDSYSNCWLTVIQLKPTSRIKPDTIIQQLEKHNIESRLVWKPMHLQPIFKKYDYIDNGDVANQLFKYGVCLPSDTKMTAAELFRVCCLIKELWSHV